MRSSQIGNGGNIPLQEYADGVPPPPAPGLSWKRIDRWMESNYPELAEEVNDEATSYDLNELEADLECTFPLDVRDSFLIHDGQERGGRPCGLIFNLILLDLESVSEEWTHWKNTGIKISKMAKAYHANQRASAAAAASAAVPGPSSAVPPGNARRMPKPAGKASGNLSWLDHQESVPEGAIQRVYAHPGWIPLISDFLGNYIGVDLAPGPKGRWGQVILFGREFDRKYVVAPSWAAFLMTFADDLENGNHLIEDETEVGELSFRASNGRLVPYFDVLRSRTDRLQRLNRKPNPATSSGPYQASGAGRRPGSQTNLAAAGARISPRNSTTVVPGRNVSGNFRRPNQVPTLSKEARLISPMNSSSHLPVTGLSKPSVKPVPMSASKQSPKQSPKPAVEEPDTTEPKSLIDDDIKPTEPVKETKVAESKPVEEKKDETKPVEVKDIAVEDKKENEAEAKEDSKASEDTKNEKEEKNEKDAKDTKESQDSKDSKESETPKPTATTTTPASPSTPKSSKFQISDAISDSDDEVDLLKDKDELTEVAI